MSAYLLCLSINGGIPLFTRKNGDLKSIPFPLLASLNGVAMFGQSHDVTLLSTMTRECRILWRDYHNSVRLIVVVPLDTVSDFHIHRSGLAHTFPDFLKRLFLILGFLITSSSAWFS